MKKIESEGKVYAIYDHIGNPKNEAVWYGKDEDYMQASKMGYDIDREFKTHRHLFRPRTIPHTQEVMVVVSGCLEATIYDENKNLLDKCLLYNGSIIVLYSGYHGFRTMCDNTVFYEIKHGNFVGVEKDKEYL